MAITQNHKITITKEKNALISTSALIFKIPFKNNKIKIQKQANFSVIKR